MVRYCLVLLVAAIVGCAPTAQVSKLSFLEPAQKVVVFPALAPADVSQIVTPAIEEALTQGGHTFTRSSEVVARLSKEDLLKDYSAFLEAYESLGIVDPSFLARFRDLGSHYMFIEVTAWAQGGGWFSGVLEDIGKSKLQRIIEESIAEVRDGETLVGLSVSLYSEDGVLVYKDANEAKLSDPFKTPSFEKIAQLASWRFGMTLPKHEVSGK